MQSGNAGVMRAVEEVRTMNLGKMVRTLYEARLKAKRDQWAMEEAMKEDSMAAVLDLLGDFGEIPEDIRNGIAAEENTEVLRRWLKLAARAENFEDFRNKVSQDDGR